MNDELKKLKEENIKSKQNLNKMMDELIKLLAEHVDPRFILARRDNER